MSWELSVTNPIAARVPLMADAGSDLAAEGLMDSEAFAAFYGRAARPLWAYLARVSGSPSLADDLAQESFVRFLGADQVELLMAEGEIAARRYLFRIASNLLHDHWRRPATGSLEDVSEESLAAADRSGQADSQAMLGFALPQLRPRDRQLLWLAYAEGYSHREIAQITGLAGASIRLLLFRARRRAGRLLGAQYGMPADTLHEAGTGDRSEAGQPGQQAARQQPIRSRP